MVNACQRWESKTPLEEFQNRTMLIQLPRNITTFRPGRHYERGYTHTHAIRVYLRRRHMIEIAKGIRILQFAVLAEVLHIVGALDLVQANDVAEIGAGTARAGLRVV